ncbi:MAG: DUF177 domain-containing protein [Oscillospiraceae bacterium]|jgi:uncharacterized protein|nr:DUF177 domain-containing protein [Oscillospiraceae bacterium]
MRLDVSKALAAEGEEIPFSGEVSLQDAQALGEAVAFPAPAQIQGFFATVGEAMHVRGSLSFTARARCVNCLSETQRPMTAEFDAMFALTPDPTDPDLYLYDGAWIDLADMALDSAALALPMRWLCGDDCKGLCPICGANLNETGCSCPVEALDAHPLSALRELITEDNEGGREAD